MIDIIDQQAGAELGQVYNSKRDCGKRNLVEFLLNELFPNRYEECNRDYLIMQYIINIKEVWNNKL